jgi:LysR family transcriptional regulator, regulator of abg operon
MERSIRAFLAVARFGNLTAAGDAIGLTQPALTKSIQRLEDEYQAALFERTVKGMELTAAGEKLLARARKMEMHEQYAREEVRAAVTGQVDKFTIAAGMVYHMAMAPDLAKRLSAEFPSTLFVLDFNAASVTLPMLLGGEVDFLLGAFEQPIPDGLHTVKLMEFELCAFCSADDPLASSSKVKPADLVDRRWIIYKRDYSVKVHLDAFFGRYQLPAPTIAMEIEALAAAFRVVAGSKFLTVAPASLEAVTEPMGVRRVRTDSILNLRTGAWYRDSLASAPIVQRAIEILREMAENGMK